jgi:hypothetical protein
MKEFLNVHQNAEAEDRMKGGKTNIEQSLESQQTCHDDDDDGDTPVSVSI